MPLNTDAKDFNNKQTPRATRSSLGIDDSAALLLATGNDSRLQKKSRNPFRRLFSKLGGSEKGELSHHAGQEWQRTQRWCPEEEAGWLSRLFFIFANSLIRKGARKHLEQHDLWDTAHQDEPSTLWDTFAQQLQATASQTAPQGCVWRALYRVHGRVFAVTGFIKLLHDVIMFSQPYILEQLLHHLTGASDKYIALGLAFALLTAALLEALTINVYFNMLFRMSLHTKTQLLEMLYRKSLRVSSAVKSALGVGPIVNLQSNDAAKLWTMPTYLHMVWNGPFQVIVVMAMLVRVLTVWPALAGLAVTIAIIPLTMLLGKMLTAARRESVAAADQRVKLVTEVITGIKAIKLYAWEEPYLTRITALREAELRAIRKTQLLSMINSSIFNTGPVLVSLAAFGVYAALGYSLTAAVAFPSLALFNLLRFPIVMIPQQIMNLIAASVGIGRIQRFMDSAETTGVTRLGSRKSQSHHSVRSDRSAHSTPNSNNSNIVTTANGVTDGANGIRSPDLQKKSSGCNVSQLVRTPRADSDVIRSDLMRSCAVQITRSSFSWEGDLTHDQDHDHTAAAVAAVLHDIQLSVPQGSLVIVVGPVGSGKSSLLNAVLGEMVAVGDSSSTTRPVSVTGSVAYTAQDPWIQNATLRNNVLMGLPFDEARYQRTVDACCLEKDLEMLPAGDESEIGEKGINLSGGQKHRVALARAVYAAADVYLLDDPLSAVDVHVGRHLFEQCVCGELADKTRLLVTHQLQYLPHADLVVVMSEGRIAHIGTYQQLVAAQVDLAAFVPLQQDGDQQEQQQQEIVSNGVDGTACSPRFSKQQHSSQQDNTNSVFVLDSPVTSPRSPNPTAAVAALCSPRTVAAGNARPNAATDSRSFSGTVIELPSYITPLAPGLSSANSFASHKPLKLGKEFMQAAGIAEESGEAAEVNAALNSARSGGSARKGTQLTTIEDLLDEEMGTADDAQVVTFQDSAAAAAAAAGSTAAVGTARNSSTDGPAAVLAPLITVVTTTDDSTHNSELNNDSSSSSSDDEAAAHTHESMSLMSPSLKSPHSDAASGPDKTTPNHSLAAKAKSQLVKTLSGISQKTGISTRSSSKGDRGGGDGNDESSSEVMSSRSNTAGAGADRGRLVKAEERAKGQVKRLVYVSYLGAWGPFFLLPIAVTLGALVERGLQVLQNYVLSAWSNATSRAASSPGEFLSGYDTRFYLILYFVLGLSSVGVVLVRSAWLVLGSIAASRQLHSQLLAKMLRLPMSFYDSQPTGRLINRFTKDTEALDIQMAAAVSSALTCLVGALLSIVVVVVVSPYTILALLPLGLLYYRVQRLYIATSRELKRLDALAFSPIFQHYGESLAGLATIRAFGRQQLFMNINRAHIEQSNRAWWPIQLLNRWLSMRLELTGAFVVFITALAVGVIAPRNAGLAGLALTSALNLTGTLAWMVRQTTELEVNMNSVERLLEYRTQPEEAAAVVEPRPPTSWPDSGSVQAVQLVVKYRPELPPVLKGLSFSINAGEKVGICGRTGCGKSTLMMVLFRMVEPSGGAILIDGLETSKIGLTDLRSRLSLVPQDPVIFSGTVRSNLDPFDQAGSDAAIWEALRQAGMNEFVKALGAGLDSPIQEGGNNLSSGQRQLLCMARALLRSSRILVLDEATSNVDQASDTLIQKTIRNAFSHCTVLTIAHRLHTIADADRVMVLDQGQLREFDSPAELMQVDGGVFRGLMEEASRHNQGVLL